MIPEPPLRSSAAFPLRESGGIIGTLSVYSAEVGYFDERLVEVLERIAAMLSLALDNLKREVQRVEAEASLRESEARFRSLSELTADWYWQQDDQFRFIDMAAGSTAKINSVSADRYMGKTRWEQPGCLGWIDISDNGSGIPAEIIGLIFDPFFTTKQVGIGTGLGLSLSYSIIEKHGGRIEVDSEPGDGARFRVWLPIRSAVSLRP